MEYIQFSICDSIYELRGSCFVVLVIIPEQLMRKEGTKKKGERKNKEREQKMGKKEKQKAYIKIALSSLLLYTFNLSLISQSFVDFC